MAYSRSIPTAIDTAANSTSASSSNVTTGACARALELPVHPVGCVVAVVCSDTWCYRQQFIC